MRVSDEVMELVAILNELGFGLLAGELLAEISLGREADDGQAGIKKSDPQWEEPNPEDEALSRVSIHEHEQLGAAVAFLRLRLVEPVRRMAEAERIAARLAAHTANAPALKTRAMRIAFDPPADGGGVRFERTETPGATTTADQLDEILMRLIGHEV